MKKSGRGSDTLPRRKSGISFAAFGEVHTILLLRFLIAGLSHTQQGAE